MSCLALRRGKGLAPPLTEIFANCQDLFLIFEFSLIFNQGGAPHTIIDHSQASRPSSINQKLNG